MSGLAAIQLERCEDAAKAFGTLAGFGSKLGLGPLSPIANIMLGRAHAGAGRVSEARNAYEDAFKIWKDADADIPC